MTPFEYLNEKDKKVIEDYIAINGPQYKESTIKNKNRASLNHILRFWNKEKENIFHAFGDKLILEKEIEYIKPQNLLEDEFMNYVNSNEPVFLDNLIESMEYGDMYREYHTNILPRLHSLVRTGTLMSNKWNEGNLEMPLPSGKIYKISNGMKVTKILSKLAEEFNIKGYEEFRIKHSQILNQKKLKGKLCLSIHPIDYMTMSDNRCGWSSCMNWETNGSYRLGIVEMMNSPYVIIAYLKSKNDWEFADYKISNKKWRELFIVHPDVICEVKAYPYKNKEFTKIVLEWLKELFDSNNEKYENALYKLDSEDELSYGDKKNIYFEPECSFMYNDFSFDHYGYLANHIKSNDMIEFNYSGQTECMWCGETHINNEETVFCQNCEKVHFCWNCEEVIFKDESVEIDGEFVCKDCYRHSLTCFLDKKRHLNRNLLFFDITKNGYKETISTITIYDEYVDMKHSCFIGEKWKKVFKENKFFDTMYWCDNYKIEFNNLTEEGLKLFNLI